MDTTIHTLEKFFGAHLWTLHVVITLLLTFSIQLFVSRIVHKLRNEAKEKSLLYPESFLHAISAPIILIIWLIGLSIAAAMSFPNQKDFWLFAYLGHIKKTGIILALTWGTVRFIRQVENLTIANSKKKKRGKNSKEVDETMVHALALLLTIAVVIVGGLAIMQLFGLPISGLLAFGGLGGAAVAFASKDLLANFFGGLVVYLDKPFKVGHAIRSPDKNIEGTVEHIGWRVTRIRTFDKRALYVPNGFFLNISVENITRMLNRRIKTFVGIRYQDVSKINKIVQDIEAMLKAHPGIDQKLNIIVALSEFGDSSLDILLDAFTKTINRAEYQAVRHDIFMKVLEIVDSNDAECAFPTQTLYIESEQN